MYANKRKFLASTNFTLCCQHWGFAARWWNYSPVEIGGKAVIFTGVASCLLSSPRKGAVHQRGEGTGRDLCSGSERTCTSKTEGGLFYCVVMAFRRNVHLNSIDSTFIPIYLKISSSKEEFAVCFPFIDTLKKKRLYSGSLLLGYCQLKYLGSSVLIRRQQTEVSLSTGTILSAAGIGAWKGKSCSPSSWGVLILSCSSVPVRSKSTYRLP